MCEEQSTTAPDFAACSGPGDSHTPDPALADGVYTFHVRATDQVANVGLQARDFTVDTVAPDTTIDSGPTGTITTNEATFTFSASEADTIFECRIDAEPFVACSGSGTSHTASGLSDGPHAFEVRATDQAGNTGPTVNREFTVDTTPPDTVIDSGPTGTITSGEATFTFSGDPAVDIAGLQCRIDSGSFADCSSPKTFIGLSDGPHTVAFRAEDTAGNQDPTPATRTFTVDTTPPVTTIDSGPTGTISTNEATFTFSSTEAGSSFECGIDGGSFSPCSSPKSYPGLSDGPHRFAVRAIDQSGNTDISPVARVFTVDTTVYKAKIGKVKVSGPGKVKKSKKATYKVKISNTGNADATGVKVKVKGKGVKAKKSVGTITAGKAKTVKIRLKPKKPGKVKASFRVTSTNAGGKTVKKKITVKK